MEINRIPAPIPFAAAKAYAASKPNRPTARVDQMVGQPAPSSDPVDRVDIASRNAMRERVKDLVAAKVDVKPFSDSGATQPARDPSVLQLYRHPADKNAAAVTYRGNTLDVQA